MVCTAPSQATVVEPVREESCEPWSERRITWRRWLSQHRPHWRVASVSQADAYYHRIVEQFRPKPKQWDAVGGMFSFRYQHPKRLYVISYEDTRILERLILEKVVASERELRYAGWPYNVWFQYYETPELTLDRHRAYIGSGVIREYCFDQKGDGWGNPPCYYENAGVNPRWIMRDPDTGEVFLDKDGKPMKMFSGGVGVEYFMSPTGNDNNPGTSPALPWLTFNRIWSANSPVFQGGDILTLLSGTHLQRFQPPNNSKNGTSLNRTTVRPIAGGTVIIRPSGGMGLDDAAHAYWEIGRTGTIIDLDMSASTEDNAAGWRLREGTNNCRFRNVDMHHNGLGHSLNSSSAVSWSPGDSALVQGDGTGHEFFDCKGRDSGRPTVGTNGESAEGYAMYCSSSNLLIEGCEWARCVGYGFHFNILEADAPKPGLVYRRTKAHHNVAQTVMSHGGFGGSNAILSGTTGALVFNSLFYRFQQSIGGARSGFAMGALPCYNTSCVYNDSAFHTDPNAGSVGIRVFAGFTKSPFLTQPSTNNTIRNCISFSNNINFLNEPNGATPPVNTVQDHNAFGINPNWVNSAADDYHLTASTPGTIQNAGLSVPSVTVVDYDGVSRGNPSDIGAYEVAGSQADTSPPAAPTGVFVS